ncbi:MAG TPA: hypothetical protein VFZ48_00450 [Candidatus Saccharimonadales bacterium]
MAVLTQPSIPTITSVCIVDGKLLALHDATIVSQYVNGQPALACKSHREDKLAWISKAMAFEQYRPVADTSRLPEAFGAVELYTERRHAHTLASLKSDICWHMITRSTAGRILILTDHPIEFLSTVRKYWKKLTKQILIERARTLEKPKVSSLQLALERFYTLRFSGSLKGQEADILVLSVDALPQLKVSVATIYICQDFRYVEQSALLSVLQSGGAIIDYSATFSSI